MPGSMAARPGGWWQVMSSRQEILENIIRSAPDQEEMVQKRCDMVMNCLDRKKAVEIATQIIVKELLEVKP